MLTMTMDKVQINEYGRLLLADRLLVHIYTHLA